MAEDTSIISKTETKRWALDHIGHVVINLDESARRYVDYADGVIEAEEDLTEQLVRVAFIRIGGAGSSNGSLIELISPLAGNSNLQSFIKKRGEGLHHLCYRVDSVAQELERLKSNGVELIDLMPRRGSRGLDVAFLHPRAFGGVLIELCSKP